MAEFNEIMYSTTGTPAVDIVRILILQSWNDLIEAIEAYNKVKNKGITPDIGIVKARAYTLYLKIQALLLRKLKEEEMNQLELLLQSNNMNNIMQAVRIFNRELDLVQLTKIDNRPAVDRSRPVLYDKAHGLG